MSGWRVVLCGLPTSSSRLYFDTSMNLSFTVRMSPFLSPSETMLVTFMMSVRTLSSDSTSARRAVTCASLALASAFACSRVRSRSAAFSRSEPANRRASVEGEAFFMVLALGCDLRG